MSSQLRIQIATEELLPLREGMRDIQMAASRYYAETARGGDLGAQVRAFLVSAQTLNDWLAESIEDSKSYKNLLASHPQVGLIMAVKYARNVTQHVLHIVKPSDDLRLIGGAFGLRVYALWDEIPPQVHGKLRPRTQDLKASYDKSLLSREVTQTMLAVLALYAELVPEIVHRDERGEWTGFPLLNQPGVGARLHPEEPLDLPDARAWLDSRRPNGDSRVICGQSTFEGTRYIFGFTFIGRYSFSPFVETVDQIRRDIAAGFLYLEGDVLKNVEDATGLFPMARQGPVLASRDAISSWASQITLTERDTDWCEGLGAEDWRRMIRNEHAGWMPATSAYEIRRARRLNAFVPPST